jgi:hypothetical protein
MPFPKSYSSDTGYNLHSFRKVIDDISRPYLFMVEIPNIDTDARKLTAFAASTSIPAYNLNVDEFEFQGAKRKVVNGATFEDWEVEFITDQVYSLRSKFLAWMNQAYDPHQNSNASPHSYKYDGVKVHQLSRVGEKVQTYQFIGLFPKSLGKIELGHDKTDYSKFTVSFAYDYFSVDSGSMLEKAIQLTSGTDTESTINLSGVVGRPPKEGTPQNDILGIFDVYAGTSKPTTPVI